MVLLVTLVGCPSGGSSAPVPAAGERWRFRLAQQAEQTYEVTAVTADEVRFAVRTSHAGEELGAPLEQVFPLRPGAAPFTAGEPGAPLVISGRTLETWVTEDRATRVTTAVTGRTPTFPGVVKVERGGEVLLELVEVR